MSAFETLFVIYAVTFIPSMIACHYIAKAKDLNYVDWVWCASFLGLLTIPLILLWQTKKS